MRWIGSHTSRGGMGVSLNVSSMCDAHAKHQSSPRHPRRQRQFRIIGGRHQSKEEHPALPHTHAAAGSEITLRACGVQFSEALAVVSKFIKPPWKVRPPLKDPTKPPPSSPCAECAGQSPRPSCPATNPGLHVGSVRGVMSRLWWLELRCAAVWRPGGRCRVQDTSRARGQSPHPLSCVRPLGLPTVLLLLCAFTQP